MIRGAEDLIDARVNNTGEFSVRFFTGQNAGNKGMADLLLFKLSFKEYYIHEYLDKLGIASDAKTVIRAVLQSHDSYRSQLCTYAHCDQPVNLSWMSTFSKAEKEALSLGEVAGAQKPMIMYLSPERFPICDFTNVRLHLLMECIFL